MSGFTLFSFSVFRDVFHTSVYLPDCFRLKMSELDYSPAYLPVDLPSERLLCGSGVRFELDALVRLRNCAQTVTALKMDLFSFSRGNSQTCFTSLIELLLQYCVLDYAMAWVQFRLN